MMPHRQRPRPRVLALTTTLPRWPGDSEPRFVLDLARSILPRYEVVILAPLSPGAKQREVIDGVEIQRFRYAPFRSWERLASPGAILPNLKARRWLALLVPGLLIGEALALLKALRQDDVALVHCHWIIPQGLVARVASLVSPMPPLLITCHGADAFALNGGLARRLKRWTLRGVNGVTVVSREIRSLLAAEYTCLAHDSLHHIPMGVDLALFEPPEDRARSHPATILCAGRLSEKKGVRYLLEALAAAPLRDRDIRVRIVGDGPLRAGLDERARGLGLTGKVTFVGALPHEALAGELARASVFCAPFVIAASGDREGMPTALLEAAAAKLPIVTSDVGGAGELVETGRSGWLVPPGDVGALASSLAEALDDPDEARRRADEAFARVRNYGWAEIGRRYGDVIADLIGATGDG